jgi:hypothetical protein
MVPGTITLAPSLSITFPLIMAGIVSFGTNLLLWHHTEFV